jgi:ubiquitin C-terminal hydrolase
MSEEPDRPDAVVAKEFWDAFAARNKSIIIDLLYGQLKSTV